jgi:hypothetical protein
MDTSNTDAIMLANVQCTKRACAQCASIQNVNDDCLKANGDSKNVTFENDTCTGGHDLSIGGGGNSLEFRILHFVIST